MFRQGKRERVLAWLHANPGWRYASDIAKGAGLAEGTFYPELARLCREGWIERAWVEREGWPRRCGYRVRPLEGGGHG